MNNAPRISKQIDAARDEFIDAMQDEGWQVFEVAGYFTALGFQIVESFYGPEAAAEWLHRIAVTPPKGAVQ